MAQTPIAPIWVARLSAVSGIGVVSDLDVDSGAVFLTGANHVGTHALVGPSSRITMDLGSEIAFYAGVTSDGAPLWLQPNAGAPFPAGFHVAAAGSVMVTGEGPFPDLDIPAWAVGSTLLTGRDPTTGDVLWTRTLGASVETYEPQTNAVVKALAVEPDGSVFVAGLFRDTLALGSDVLVATAGGEPGRPDPYEPAAPFDAFIARLSPEGTPLWGVAVGGAGAEWVSFGPLDDQGAMGVGDAVFLAGSFPEGSTVRRGDPTSGPLQMVPSGSAVLAFDQDGEVVRVIDREALGVTSTAYPYALATPRASSGGEGFALAWWFPRADGAERAAVTVGGRVISDPDFQGVFVSRHGPDGSLDWAVPVTGGGFEQVRGLAIGPEGRTWIGGDFDGSVLRLGGATLRREGNGDGFVTVIGPGGDVQSFAHITGPDVERVQGIEIAPDGTAYVAGGFEQAVEIGTVPVSASSQGREVFVARFDALGPLDSEAFSSADGLPRLTVSPNPAAGSTTVVLNVEPPARARLRVFDMLGRLVVAPSTIELGGRSTRVPLGVSGLSPGTYVVEVVVEGSGGRAATSATVLAVIR